MAQSALRIIACSVRLLVCDRIGREHIRTDGDGIRFLIHILQKGIFSFMGTDNVKYPVIALQLRRNADHYLYRFMCLVNGVPITFSDLNKYGDVDVHSECQARHIVPIFFDTIFDQTLILPGHVTRNILHVYPDLYVFSVRHALYLLRRQHRVRCCHGICHFRCIPLLITDNRYRDCTVTQLQSLACVCHAFSIIRCCRFTRCHLLIIVRCYRFIRCHLLITVVVRCCRFVRCRPLTAVSH